MVEGNKLHIYIYILHLYQSLFIYYTFSFRQELVFIGVDLDREKVEKCLDECLLTWEEMKEPEYWKKLAENDPFVWDGEDEDFEFEVILEQGGEGNACEIGKGKEKDDHHHHHGHGHGHGHGHHHNHAPTNKIGDGEKKELGR